MYWIQEIGAPGSNRTDQKLIYAEYIDDLKYLPDIETNGDINYAVDKLKSTVEKLKYGDQVLCLQNKKLYILQSNNVWVEV